MVIHAGTIKASRCSQPSAHLSVEVATPTTETVCLLPRKQVGPQSSALGLTGIDVHLGLYAKLEAVAAEEQTQCLFSQVYKGVTISSRKAEQPAGPI